MAVEDVIKHKSKAIVGAKKIYTHNHQLFVTRASLGTILSASSTTEIKDMVLEDVILLPSWLRVNICASTKFSSV